LLQGGTVEFEMQDVPNKELVLDNGAPQLNMDFIPVPFIATPSRIFNDSITITMGITNLPGKTFAIEYAVEQGQHMGSWVRYNGPFSLKESAKIHVRGTTTNNQVSNFSSTMTSTFTKTDANCSLELKTAYAPAYAAAGPNTLIDKIRGSNDFRTGDWQGFQGKDLSAVVTFTTPRDLRAVGVSYLRDLRSWIFDPSSIMIEISTDGKTFTQAAAFSIDKPTKETEEKVLGNLVKDVAFKQVTAIRYTVKNSGVCPDWHLGVGNPTWLFLDELIFE